MPIETIKLPPGLQQNATRYTSKNHWHRANLMRFRNGFPQPIGGWSKQNDTNSTGRANAMFAWVDNSGNGWVALGTEQKLYVYDDTFTRYDITPAGFTTGAADQGTYSGYGQGFYGLGLYGTPQPLSGGIPLPASTWSFDVWGEYLIAQHCGSGPIYEWQLNTGTPAAAVTNAPSSSEAIIVTNQRILLAFGATGDPRRIQGSDVEVNTTWTPATNNACIDRKITSATGIVTARKFRGDILIFTKDALQVGRFVGAPYVYEFTEVGDGCDIQGRNAVGVTDDMAIWMGAKNFWMWDGGSIDLLECAIAGEVFDDLNAQQNSKVYTVVNSAFSEVTFYYPAGASTECDAYVSYNYAERHWTRGALARTCGVDRGAFPRPLLADSVGDLYEHEIGGASYDGAMPYLESGPLEVGQGERLLTVNKIWPDDTDVNDDYDDPANLTFYLKAQLYPGASIRTVGPINNARPQGTRITGRQIALRVEGTPGVWRTGNHRVEFQLRGGR